jgi:hypothetical protein
MTNINLLHVLALGCHPQGVMQIKELYSFDLKDSPMLKHFINYILFSAFDGCINNNFISLTLTGILSTIVLEQN